MANEVFVYRIRLDLGVGAHQITDLTPNTSRRRFSYEVYGQSGYLPPRVDNNSVVGLANPTTADITGLSAYIFDNTADGITGNQLTFVQADAIATTMILIADAGGDLDEDRLLQVGNFVGVGAGTMPYPSLYRLSSGSTGSGSAAGTASIDGAGSTGSQAGLLQALCGGVYTFPAGSVANPTVAPNEGDGSFNNDAWRQLFGSGAFSTSATAGDIAHYAAANYTYAAVAGPAVVAYNLAGTVQS